MIKKDRIIAYFDGSNFYHLCKINFKLTTIDLEKIARQMLKQNEELLKIKYFNSPVNHQEEPEKYSKQQRFFDKVKQNPLLELNLGRLVKRPLNKITIKCDNCGLINIESLECPKCKKKILVNEVYKSTEKGLDVQIAIKLILDAINDNFDSALLFSGDADFAPAIEHIIKKIGKKVIFCSFPKPRTNELIGVCSETRFIKRSDVESSKV